ncbi:CatB-related O-acetyltransferase [Vibrio campbellii]|uniref:CatB-related O-acetyltransferase n=2 Tax=Vibrio campbellii TaxID=680 RepID=UPI003989AFA7
MKQVIKVMINFIVHCYHIFRFKNIELGRGSYICKTSYLAGDNLINDYARIINSNIGRYSYVSPFSILIDADVGRYCSIGPGSKIGLGIHDLSCFSTSPYIKTTEHNGDFQRVTLGHDVWVGAGCLIMGGLTIGTGAVIGAGAVVTKSVQPYEIVVGNPAKPIRKRFSDEKIRELLNSRWWDKSLEEINNER